MAIKKNDWIELKYTGIVNGNVFDSNIEEDLKKLDPKGKPHETVVSVGNKMVVSGLDENLEGKEIGKEYEVKVPFEKGFGPRKREFVKTIPLKYFHEQKVEPRAGMVFNLDNQLVKIITVSGARVIVDFNNPLAGKELKYKFKVEKLVDDVEKRVKGFFSNTVRFVPEFSIGDKKVTIKGPKQLEAFSIGMADKFKELIGLDLGFEEASPGEKKREASQPKGEKAHSKGESDSEKEAKKTEEKA